MPFFLSPPFGLPGKRSSPHDRVQEILRSAVRLPEPLATTAGGDGGSSSVQDTPLPPSSVRLPARIRAPALTRAHCRRPHAGGGDFPTADEQRCYSSRGSCGFWVNILFIFLSLLFSFLFICKFTFPNRRWIRLWFGMQERDHETSCIVASVLDIRSWWVDLYKYFPLRQTLVKIGFLNRRCNKCPKTTMCVVYCNARPCWNAVNSRNYPLKNVQNKCEVSL